MSKNRYVKDGQVAVLISPGFGAGWSTWADSEYRQDCLFDPWIVDVIVNGEYSPEEKLERIAAHCAVKYPGLYLGGLEDLTVDWIPEGAAFRVDEYDGSESVDIRDQGDWITA